MFHPNTQRMITYWQARRTSDVAPARSTIDPADFAALVPQVFILGRRTPGDWRFRLAGELLTDLHRSGLHDKDGLAGWKARHRLELSSCLEAARRRGQAFVATARAFTSLGRSADIQILYAPLQADKGDVDRCLGLYQPLTPLGQLGGQAVERFALSDIESADAAFALPSLRLAVLDGRRIA